MSFFKPELPGLPGLGSKPDVDDLFRHARGNLERFPDPFENLSRQDDFFNPFDDIISATYMPDNGLPRFIRSVNRSLENTALGLQDITIDFDLDGRTDFTSFGRAGVAVADRTSSELMTTLQRHWGGVNIGRHKDYITPEELSNYLVRVGDNIKSEDRRDLEIILRSFRRIADADGKKADKGISMRDMSAYTIKNSAIDEIILTQRENRALKEENERLRAQLDGRRETQAPSPRGAEAAGRVITERNERGHYSVSGADLPLSQEAFKKHYGIPENIDLLKFLPGKPVVGDMPDYWGTDGVSVGLGGHIDENDPASPLKWNTPDYHSLKYDFSRNFAQVFPYLKNLPVEKQEEFAFNFARTQVAVFKADGYDLLTVDNEKVLIGGRDNRWIDFVQDVGTTNPKMQF